MKNTLMVLFLALTMFPVFASANEPKIEYVGAITITTDHIKPIVDWYSRFGLVPSGEDHGIYYGGLPTAAGPFYFGFHPSSAPAPVGQQGRISITFRVSGFSQYVAALVSKNIKPVKQSHDSVGSFATFLDPDGNQITIWGE